jgi:opacity protein-like surface antigen
MRSFLTIAAAAILTLLISLPTATAQTPMELGAKVGLNFASVTGSDSKLEGQGPDMIVRGSGGLFLNLGLSRSFSVQAEIYYNQKGADWEYAESSNDTTWSYKLNIGLEYVEFAVLAKYSIPTSGKMSPFLYGGPAVAINAASEAKIDVEMDTSGTLVYAPGPDYFSNIHNAKSTIFEILLGGGVDIALGNNTLSIEGRYTFSLDKAFDDPEDLTGMTDDDALILSPSGQAADMKHSVISVLIGFSLPI